MKVNFMLMPETGFFRNLRDLPASISLSAVVAGLVVAVVSYSGPILIILEAAKKGGLSEAQTSSWVWAIVVGNGLTTIFLSLYYRQPITTPWSTAGAALLAISLVEYPYGQAIGAYILVGIAMILLGLSGWFARAMRLIPQPIVLGMLAGVLLRFGIGLFAALPERPIMVMVMVAVYFGLRRFKFRAPTLGALVVGMVIAALGGELHIPDLSLALTVPQFTAPEFSLHAAVGLALPLFALALTSQYAPGQGVLRASGYEAPINRILTVTGIMSSVIAFFGGHGVTLGALTAAIVTNPEAHPDPHKRYAAAVCTGLWHVLLGSFGAGVIALFAAFPAALAASVAGLALSATIGSSLAGAMADPALRDAALAAFLCTAANFTLFGVGAPFWGLVVGVAVYLILRQRTV